MLTLLPCVDSPDHAAARAAELNIRREVAHARTEATLRILADGGYTLDDGATVDLRAAVAAAMAQKESLPPTFRLQLPPPSRRSTTVQVSNETTMAVGQRLVADGLSTVALNFANGLTPGGGFLTGALAQEECLCRASALYPTLVDDPMYAAHSKRKRPDSSDWCIHSPAVPFFRDDQGRLLATPWSMGILTCAAPVAGGSIGRAEAAAMMVSRVERVLAVAAARGYAALVLGAWGCGAFHNDPHAIADLFRAALEGPFAGHFSTVAFAIADWSPERRFLGPFRDAFAA